MSGGIAQLVAIGAQDAHLVGQPEVSFFRSNYRRHTNFAQTTERQVLQGNPTAGGISTVRFERKGDLLGYCYITRRSPAAYTKAQWSTYIKKVELLVGGQVIDEQTSHFSQYIAPTVMAQTTSKAPDRSSTSTSRFYPLRFSFCENWQSALPLIALQYHDVELRITWNTSVESDFEVHAQYIYLDTDERTTLASLPQNMVITQTQRSVASGTAIQELNFNHPVKLLASSNVFDSTALGIATGSMKLQINGTDVTDAKPTVPHYTECPLYYHTACSSTKDDSGSYFLYPFCLETSKLQPTGSLNFSRLDSARLVSTGGSFTAGQDIYAVNYNILRIENGMGGLMYSN
jgi:hypothetical protein